MIYSMSQVQPPSMSSWLANPASAAFDIALAKQAVCRFEINLALVLMLVLREMLTNCSLVFSLKLSIARAHIIASRFVHAHHIWGSNLKFHA